MGWLDKPQYVTDVVIGYFVLKLSLVNYAINKNPESHTLIMKFWHF